MGASSSRRLGWLMKISRDAAQSCLISDSVSCTNFPGFEDRTSISLSIILSKTTGSIAAPCRPLMAPFPFLSSAFLHTHTRMNACGFGAFKREGASPLLVCGSLALVKYEFYFFNFLFDSKFKIDLRLFYWSLYLVNWETVEERYFWGVGMEKLYSLVLQFSSCKFLPWNLINIIKYIINRVKN